MVIRRKARGWSIVGALTASAALIAGCGGSSRPPILHQPAALTRGFSLKISVSESLDDSRVDVQAAGAFAAHGRGALLSLDMVNPSFDGSGAMPVVVTGGTIYERLPSQLAGEIPGARPWLSMKVSQLSALGQLPGLDPFLRESLMFADPAPYLKLLQVGRGIALLWWATPL